jgi:hypothetical protein
VNIVLAWEILFGLNIGMLLLIYPVLLFFYESDPDLSFCGRVRDTVVNWILYVGLVFFVATIIYFFGNVYPITYSMQKTGFDTVR